MDSLQSVPCILTQHLFQSKLNSSIDFQKKYLNTNFLQHHENQDVLRQDIARVNGNLDALGLHRLGDLFSASPYEIDKTLAVVKELLDRRQKELEYRSQTAYKIRKLESQRDQLAGMKERWMVEKQSLELDRERLVKKTKEIDSNYKETITKLTQERDDLSKQLAKSMGKQQQFKNELKKRDNTILQLQESIKKMQNDKSITYRNSFDVIGSLQQTGPFVYYVNADHQYGQLNHKNFQSIYQKLCTQNKFYKDSLMSIHQQLNQILQFRKDLYMKRKSVDGDDSVDASSMNLSSFRSEMFNVDKYKEGTMEVFEDNVKKFREFLDRMDLGGDGELRGCNQNQYERLKSVKNVKSLIKRYKFIVESQDDMLAKLVLKAKDARQLPQPRRTLLEDHDLQKARRFLEQQKQYVETKAKDIDMTKKAMAASLRKFEEDKTETSKKKRELEEEAARLRKNMELLPMQFDKD